MLVCPVFADQPFWGKRIAALGVGPEPIKMKDMTVTKLTRALVDLRLPDYRTAAESIGNAIRLEGGAAQAADAVLSASGRT
jgi:sterol 3beta-glucosyltransferase